jgi:hypothetical protein
MKNLKISFLFSLSLMTFLSFGQTDCKVLKAEISLVYEGECKNGLAHGVGEASGRDFYKGEFRNGLPHGEGTYEWASGEVYEGRWKKGLRHGEGKYSFFVNNRDTTLSGKWVNDKYIDGSALDQSYKILYKDNIGRINFVRFGNGGNIRLKFLRSGGEIGVQNLMLYGDSGTIQNQSNFVGFENADFPFSGKVVFEAPSIWHSSIMRCELRFKINEPGMWDIYIYL